MDANDELVAVTAFYVLLSSKKRKARKRRFHGCTNLIKNTYLFFEKSVKRF